MTNGSKGNVFVNEVRVRRTSIDWREMLRFRSPGLSTRHRRLIEFWLRTQEKAIAFFMGSHLFVLYDDNSLLEEQKAALSEFLSERLQKSQDDSIEIIRLGDMPKVVIEKFVLEVVKYKAASNGVFTIFGRTLFRPTMEAGKTAHLAVETTIISEDNLLKLYFDPTYLALTNIRESIREDRNDLELVSLCKHRFSCELAETDGRCPYVYPGRLGYYENEVALNSLSTEQKESYLKAYDGCPQIDGSDQVVFAKASKGAKRALAYPEYVVFSRLSDSDLSRNPIVAGQYRTATRMLSRKRWDQTNKWLNEIFGQDRKLVLDHISIPIEVIMSRNIQIDGKPTSDYRAIHIPDQRLVNDEQNPSPLTQSGGWLFSNRGALDRHSPNRSFSTVRPYLILPNTEEARLLGRSLINTLSDDKYKSRLKGDQDFEGINNPDSNTKYNCGFVNIWEEEEEKDILFVDGTEEDYLRKAQGIIREWNQSSDGNKDHSRIAIVLIPEQGIDPEEDTIYRRVKRPLLEEGIPSQFITLETLQGFNDASVRFGPVLHSLWLNIYAKMGGKPWRLHSTLDNVHCFIGIGFGIDPRAKGQHIYVGSANVFDRYGSWIDITSGSQSVEDEQLRDFVGAEKFTEGTSSFRISERLTTSLISEALELYEKYQTATKEAAQNIILHKLGPIYDCEVSGFLEAISQSNTDMKDCRLGILQIEQDHLIRLYGDSVESAPRLDRVVPRNSGLIVNSQKIILATTGSIRRGRYTTTYPGIGTPVPLVLTAITPSGDLLKKYGLSTDNFYDVETMARHAMALTQLHWGSTRDTIRLPITTLYAQKVADLVSKTHANVENWSRFHRPWFL